METQKFIEGFEPLFKMTVYSSLWVKTLSRHYIKTISELTGKTEEEIKNEMNDILTKVKAETESNIKGIDNGR
jgi:RNase P subunit RPR2